QQGIKRLRDLADRVRQKAKKSVVILGMKDLDGSKASLLVALGPEVPQSLNANEILQQVLPTIGGRGGGKADLAQAGGSQPSGLAEALNQAKLWVQKKLEG